MGHFDATTDYKIGVEKDAVTWTTDYKLANFWFQPGEGYMIYLDNAETVVWTVTY